MEHNYEGARITLVHDCYIRRWKWVDAETACLAIILSPWFSRGWTVLELARSTRVKVIFNGNVIKDLDEDILSSSGSDSACHRVATDGYSITHGVLLDSLGDRTGPCTPWGKRLCDPSALHYAVKRNYHKVASALTLSGEEDIFVTDENGTTVISLAVAKMAKFVVYALAYKYGETIWKSKQAEQGLQQAAYNSGRPLDIYTIQLGGVWEDLLGATFSDSWAAVMHLEQASTLTDNPQMQALVEAKLSQDQLTPLHLHRMTIGMLEPHVRQWISKYRSPDGQYLLEDEDEDKDENEDGEEEEDSSSESDLYKSRWRRGRREDSEDDFNSE
ncbi:hypothetical protein TMatcc_001479 [Talaromyces marneffei ATCC 18224]